MKLEWSLFAAFLSSGQRAFSFLNANCSSVVLFGSPAGNLRSISPY